MILKITNSNMGKHKEWRKLAKKERRRKMRVQQTIDRDELVDPKSTEYQEWLKEQEYLEMLEYEQIERTNLEENEKWLRAEKKTLEQWKKLQDQKERLRFQHLEEELKTKLEWEQEQERKEKEKEKIREIEEENKRKQEMFIKHLENFLSGDSIEPPQELLVFRETRPDCKVCPFFLNTGCCRFGDQCQKTHRYPGISKVLLAANFFSHFGLETANEFETDTMLEFEDNDTYKGYEEFFFDVLPEFEKFGKITQFKVCINYEKHLRGNMYVEFAELRCAVAAYRAMHTRWYGGKQLSLQFCHINSWKNGICGLHFRKRCFFGRACNFMHVFRNPNNLYNKIEESRDAERSHKSPRQSWRWSESPEIETRRWRSRSSEINRRRGERHRRDSYRREERDHHETVERRERRRGRGRGRRRDRSGSQTDDCDTANHEDSQRREQAHEDSRKRDNSSNNEIGKDKRYSRKHRKSSKGKSRGSS